MDETKSPICLYRAFDFSGITDCVPASARTSLILLYLVLSLFHEPMAPEGCVEFYLQVDGPTGLEYSAVMVELSAKPVATPSDPLGESLFLVHRAHHLL